MKKIIIIATFLSSFVLICQVKGTVTDTQNKPLSFVSIYLDNTVTGTTSNDNGNYILDLSKKGTYTIVFQFLGYKTVKKTAVIDSFPHELNVQLTEENIQLNEISISTKDNPANKIIKNVIDNKDKNTDKYGQYTAKFYSRGLYKIKDAPEKFLGQTLGDFGGGLDSTRSGIIYLSETVSSIKFQKKPKRFKEKIIASKVSGRDNGISFNRAEDANINFYDNSIEFGNELVSPISTNAFGYYNFKLVGTFYDKNGKLINKINVLPKRKNDPVFEGALHIVEDDWALYGADVTVTGAQVNIPAVDKLTLKQNYNYAPENDAWILISQTIDFKVDFFGFKFDGRFSSAYSEYDFTPQFTEASFSNEVLSFEKDATEKDSIFWNNLRPVPLTFEELQDYKVKDSINIVRKSQKYLDSLDEKRNKFGFFSPFKGYTHRNSFKKHTFSYEGPLFKTGFNTVQGFYTGLGFNYFEEINDKGKWWNAGINVNYGFSEKRIRPTLFFAKKWDNFSRPTLRIDGGIETLQFNDREPILKLNNSISSLLNRFNYFKIYEKSFGKVKYTEEIKNGIYLSTSLEYANRKPLFNNSNYSFAATGKNGGYSSNNPLSPDDFINPAFVEHTIATLEVGATFVFGQKYLSYPNSKFNIGNEKFPTVAVNYIKRFGASNNELNSDVLMANVRQIVKAGNYGLMKYNLRAGAFLKQKDIAFMDYLQVNGNQLTFPLDNQLMSFNLLEYYKFFSNDRYAEAHFEHNFKGFFFGKFPLLNKLNFHFVAGAKTMMMADKKPYSEFSLGLDNIGFGKWRLLRIDYAKSYHAGIQNDGFLLRLNLLN